MRAPGILACRLRPLRLLRGKDACHAMHLWRFLDAGTGDVGRSHALSTGQEGIRRGRCGARADPESAFAPSPRSRGVKRAPELVKSCLGADVPGEQRGNGARPGTGGDVASRKRAPSMRRQGTPALRAHRSNQPPDEQLAQQRLQPLIAPNRDPQLAHGAGVGSRSGRLLHEMGSANRGRAHREATISSPLGRRPALPGSLSGRW